MVLLKITKPFDYRLDHNTTSFCSSIRWTRAAAAARRCSFARSPTVSVLDKAEKTRVIREFDQETDAKSGRENLADTFNITTQKTAFQTAYTALKTYLEGLSPSYRDNTVPTPIVPSTFKQKWTEYYASVAVLTRAIEVEAAKRANYSQVVDDQGTKPEDNATVGAPAGTYVAGQLSEEVVAQITQLEAARSALDLELEDLIADVETTKGRVTAARTDLDQARTDLDAEIARAVDSEDAIRTTVTTAQGRADQAYTAFETEKTQRVGADVALGQRIDTTVSSIATEKAALNARITSEVPATIWIACAIAGTPSAEASDTLTPVVLTLPSNISFQAAALASETSGFSNERVSDAGNIRSNIISYL